MHSQDKSRSPLSILHSSIRNSLLGALFLGLAALSTGCGPGDAGLEESAMADPAQAGSPANHQQLVVGSPSFRCAFDEMDCCGVCVAQSEVTCPETLRCSPPPSEM